MEKIHKTYKCLLCDLSYESSLESDTVDIHVYTLAKCAFIKNSIDFLGNVETCNKTQPLNYLETS